MVHTNKYAAQNGNICLYSKSFAYSENTTLFSYVPMNKKPIMRLSSTDLSREMKESSVVKSNIIQYFDMIKGRVDTVDKMLEQYSHQTIR